MRQGNKKVRETSKKCRNHLFYIKRKEKGKPFKRQIFFNIAEKIGISRSKIIDPFY